MYAYSHCLFLAQNIYCIGVGAAALRDEDLGAGVAQQPYRIPYTANFKSPLPPISKSPIPTARAKVHSNEVKCFVQYLQKIHNFKL